MTGSNTFVAIIFHPKYYSHNVFQHETLRKAPQIRVLKNQSNHVKSFVIRWKVYMLLTSIIQHIKYIYSSEKIK